MGNKPEFRRATTTLLAAQELLWCHPQQKGQRTISTSVITDISSIGMYITVKQLRPCCKSQLLNLIQGITRLSRQALNGETHANPKILK